MDKKEFEQLEREVKNILLNNDSDDENNKPNNNTKTTSPTTTTATPSKSFNIFPNKATFSDIIEHIQNEKNVAALSTSSSPSASSSSITLSNNKKRKAGSSNYSSTISTSTNTSTSADYTQPQFGDSSSPPLSIPSPAALFGAFNNNSSNSNSNINFNKNNKPNNKMKNFVLSNIGSTTLDKNDYVSNNNKDPSYIFRNKLAHRLSRNIPPLTLLKDHFKETISVNSFGKPITTINEVYDTIQMVNIIFQHSLSDVKVMSNIDSIIHSSTNDLLSQYQQITDKFPWEQTSQGYKDKGNEFFQKKLYHDAIILYNEALRLHSIESNKDQSILSSIHSNRCLCLINLEQYEAGALEATLGIEHNNKNNTSGNGGRLLHKLYYRRGICYYHLKRHSKAKNDFLKAHKLIEKMDSSDISSIEQYLFKIQKLNLPLHEEEQREENEEKLKKNKQPQLQKDESSIEFTKDQSIVDSRIDFKYQSDNVGRIIESNDSIESNTMLIQEFPYVSCLDRNYHSLFCYNCFKETLVPVYCKKCNNAQYCSIKCLEEDYNQQHSAECGKGFLLTCSHESLLVIRILIKKGKEFKKLYGNNSSNNNNNNNNSNNENKNKELENELLKSYIPEPAHRDINLRSKLNSNTQLLSSIFNENSTELQNLQISQDDELFEMPQETLKIPENSNIYLPKYELINSFEPHYLSNSSENLLSLIFDAFIIERFLNYYEKELGILKEDINVSTILRHLCQLASYTFAIPGYIANNNHNNNSSGGNDDSNGVASKLQVSKYKIQQYSQDKIGYAIYAMSSLMNHSCIPNTHLQYRGNTIMFKSSTIIEKGEEVLGCYGPSAFLHPLRDRIISLYREYSFICRCKACSEKVSPDSLRCPSNRTPPATATPPPPPPPATAAAKAKAKAKSERPCSGVLLERVNPHQLIKNLKSYNNRDGKSENKNANNNFDINKSMSSISRVGYHLPIDTDSILSNYEKHEDYENRLFICNACGMELYGIEAHSLTSQIIISDNLYEAGSKILMKNDPSLLTSPVEAMFIKSLEIRRNIFKSSSKKVSDLYDSLGRYFLLKDIGFAAGLYLEKFVESVNLRAGNTNSVDLGHCYAKLGEIFFSIGEFLKAEKSFEMAKKILTNWRVDKNDSEILFLVLNYKKLFNHQSTTSKI